MTQEVVQETQDQEIQVQLTQVQLTQDLLIQDQEIHAETLQGTLNQEIQDQDQHRLPTQVDLAAVADQVQHQAQHVTCQMMAFQHVAM